jgi:glycerol-3-phosphate dehydrogenase (NAD(P)+)
MTEKKVLVIGAGAWGSAISNLLADNNCEVTLVSENKDVVSQINQKNCNEKYLPNIVLNKKIKASLSYDLNAGFVFIVVPSSSVKEVFQKIKQTKFKKSTIFVILSKGIESSSLKLLSDFFEEIVESKNYAILSGPNFAAEIAQKIPSITTIASKDKNLADKVIKILNNQYFKAHYSKDVEAAEICGVVKNIMAIACGMVDGLGLGVNTKAGVVVKGVKEIELICKKLKKGCDLANGAGFGDIFLTCSSAKSRNNSLGYAIAKGEKYDKNKTYEGQVAAKLIIKLAKRLKIHLDLCACVEEILRSDFSKKQIKEKIITAILK